MVLDLLVERRGVWVSVGGHEFRGGWQSRQTEALGGANLYRQLDAAKPGAADRFPWMQALGPESIQSAAGARADCSFLP